MQCKGLFACQICICADGGTEFLLIRPVLDQAIVAPVLDYSNCQIAENFLL